MEPNFYAKQSLVEEVMHMDQGGMWSKVDMQL